MRISFFLTFILLVTACACYGFQATITVGASGNATTIQQAFAMMGSTIMADSVTLFLQDVSYNETPLTLTQHNGYPKTVKIMGNPLGEPPTITFTQSGNGGTGITVNSIEAFSLSGVNVSMSPVSDWDAAVSVHLTSGQSKAPSSYSGISVYAPSASKGLDVDIEGGGSYTVSASTFTTMGPALSPGTGINKFTVTGNTFYTDSKAVDGTNLAADTVIIANNTITKTNGTTSSVIDVPSSQGSNPRYIWIHDNVLNLSGGATTGIDISSARRGTILIDNNLMLMGGYTGCDSRGIHISGFGGLNSAITITNDSISGAGVAVWLEGIPAGTAVTMDNLGLEAAISGIMVNNSSSPASVSIGSAGPGMASAAGRWSPYGVTGASRARIRNNSRSMAPVAKPRDPGTFEVSCPAGGGIYLDLSGTLSDVTIESVDMLWSGTDGVSINGGFGGNVSLSGNMVDVTGAGTGIVVNGFGGTGARYSQDGDSVSTTGTGVWFKNIHTGTVVSMDNIGIGATVAGILMDNNSRPDSVNIGSAAPGLSPLSGRKGIAGVNGASRARVRNNAHAMAPIAKPVGSGDEISSIPVGAAIALMLADSGRAVCMHYTQVVWDANYGIHIGGGFSGSIALDNNLVNLTGSGAGIAIDNFGGPGATFSSLGDSIYNADIGISLDSVAAGTAVNLAGFGINAASCGISVPSSNHPSSLTIGGAGTVAAPAAGSRGTSGASGYSRARVMRNSRSMAPIAGKRDLTHTVESGPVTGIDVALNGGTCAVTVQNTDVIWDGDGIAVSGAFGGSVSTSGNLVDLTGTGNGITISKFGGSGASVSCDGDSISNVDMGIRLDSIPTGTAVSLTGFGILASSCGISVPATNHPSSLTIGSSGTEAASTAGMRGVNGTSGASRARVRNNARGIAPAAGKRNFGQSVETGSQAGIDISFDGGTCSVVVQNTDVLWVGDGVDVTGAFGGSVSTSDNMIDLTGSGTGIALRGFGGAGSTVVCDNDSINNSGTGIRLDSVKTGTTVSVTNFGISAGDAAISVPPGNNVAMLTIGGTGGGSVTTARSPMGITGRSRGTARNNAALMKPKTVNDDNHGAGIDVAGTGSGIIIMPDMDITWPGDGIRVVGGSQGQLSTSNNTIVASGTGILLSGFGGAGSSISCDGDSISGGATGVSADSVAPGTSVSVTNFKIRALACGVSAWGAGGINGITVGGTAPAASPKSGVRFPNPSSRARVMNNARAAAPKAGGRAPMSAPFAAIAIKQGNFTGAISVTGTDVMWDGPVGIQIGKGSGQSVSLSGNTITGDNSAGGAAVVLDSVTADSVLISGNTMDHYPLMQRGTVLANILYEVGGNSFVSGGDSMTVMNGNILVHDNEWKCQDACLKENNSMLCGTTDHLAVTPGTVRRGAPTGPRTTPSRVIKFSRNTFSDFAGHGLDLTIDRTSPESVKVVFDGNKFARTGKSCLFLHGVGSAAPVSTYMAGNSFTQSGKSGSTITINGGNFQVFDDVSLDFSGAIVAGASAPNNFTDNQENGLEVDGDITFPNGLHLQNFSGNGGYNLVNATPNPIDVTGNWWGTTDSAEIAAGIFDGADSAGLGGSTFFPYQSSAIPEANEATVSVPLAAGWNIVALPVVPSNQSKTALFPAAASNAYSFSGTYVAQSTLQSGRGYWLKATAAGSQDVTGLERVSDTVTVSAGWNLIGGLTDPIASASIASIPGGIQTSQFYGYNAGYYNADTIKMGRGYWIKSTAAGKLVLGAAAAVLPATSRIRIVPVAERPPAAPGTGDGNGGEETPSTSRELPTEFALHQNYPNPFNPSTVIRFDLPTASVVTLKVFNMLGQEVASPLNARQIDAGYQAVTIDASNLSSGTYVYRLQVVPANGAGGVFTSVKKMLLLR